MTFSQKDMSFHVHSSNFSLPLHARSLQSHSEGQPGISIAYRAPTIIIQFELLVLLLEGICRWSLVPLAPLGVVDFRVMDLSRYLRMPAVETVPIWWRRSRPKTINNVLPCLGLTLAENEGEEGCSINQWVYPIVTPAHDAPAEPHQ